jgi:hypothetical protein
MKKKGVFFFFLVESFLFVIRNNRAGLKTAFVEHQTLPYTSNHRHTDTDATTKLSQASLTPQPYSPNQEAPVPAIFAEESKFVSVGK